MVLWNVENTFEHYRTT